MGAAAPIVLIVDDDTEVLSLIRGMLSTADYVTETATTGAAALARVESGGIDLIVLDRLLPDIDGAEVCRRLRAREDELYLPILMLSGLTQAEQLDAGFVAGADDYITKPFRVDDLRNRVRAWARVRRRVKASHTRLLREAVLAMSRAMSEELSHLQDEMVSALTGAGCDSPENAARLRAALENAAGELTTRISAFHDVERQFEGLVRTEDGSPSR
jgi:DNA-binding response OmpR family regulator